MAHAVPNPPSTPRRVKVYELKNNDWFDRGTGYCTGQLIEDEPHIQVKSEEEAERILLNTRINKEDGYQKQQETLIVWTEPDGKDMALSFQEPEGCSAIWDFVNNVQTRLLSMSGADDILSDDANGDLINSIMLPSPELGILKDIENMMRTATINAHGRDALAKFVLNEDYIPKLIPLLETAEDLEMLTELHHLCNIMKTVILLNDTTIIEYIVTDEVVMGVVGILEYDPDFPSHKANHRAYLQDETRFKEVVPIDNAEVKKKIHQTYRLQYLKDVVLARILDDPTFSVLSSLIFFNQVDIVQHLQQNTSFLEKLFGLFNPDSPDKPDALRKKQGVQFIQQCTSIAKNLQAPTRQQLYQNFLRNDLIAVVGYGLMDSDPATRIAGTDILVCLIDNDPVQMRGFIFKQIQEKRKPLTDTLIELLLTERDLGVKAQIADAIKVLLDPNQAQSLEIMGKATDMLNVATNQSRRMEDPITESFFQNFYDASAKKLFQPLVDLEHRPTVADLTIHETALYSHLIEILCFFVRHHLFRNKYFILSENLASRVAQLLESPEKHLKLGALKFFRSCVGLQDDFYNRQLIKHKLLEPILNIVIETMPRDNLLNSACLEFFEFIRRESIRPLINHLVEQYKDRLKEITYVDTFSSLLNKYEQMHDTTAPQGYTREEDQTSRNQVNGGRRWQGVKEMDPSEEEYFNTSDEEDNVVRPSDIANSKMNSILSDFTIVRSNDGPFSSSGGGGGGGEKSGASRSLKPLVNYPEDDDDDDLMDTDATSKGKPASSGSEASVGSPPSPTTLEEGDEHMFGAPTPERLAEKRRRAEEEDDELGKLSRSAKKRSPSVGSTGSIKRKGFTTSTGSPGAGKKISINFSTKSDSKSGDEKSS